MPRLELLFRLRPLLPFLAFFTLIYSAMLVGRGGYESLVRYDYAVWLTVFLVCLGAYLDVKLFGKRFGYVSTVLLSVCGALITVIGRVLSLIFNQAIYSPHKIIPLFGSPYTQESFITSITCSVLGSLLTCEALTLHSILNRPLTLFRKPLHALVIWGALRRFYASFWSHKWLYLLAAFLFGFAFRFGPELLWWPWLIGWDTVEYAAHLMDFMERFNPFVSYHWMGSMRNCPPLLNILLSLPAPAIGAWNTFKLYPAVAYGFLALSSALLAKRVFRLNNFGSFLASIVTALLIINLRISWDYHRQLLGSIFMLLSVATLDSCSKPNVKAAAASGVLLICCALSHEVTALFSVALSLVLIIKSIKIRSPEGITAGLAGLVASIFLETWYWGNFYTPNVYFGVAPIGIVSYSPSVTPEVIGYLVAGFGLILPFALLSLLDRSQSTAFSKAGLFSLIVAGISPFVAPYTSAATWYRFLAGAAPLASTLAGAWIMKSISDRRFHLFFLLLLFMLAFPYAYAVEDTSRFTSALKEFPPGLIPSPMSRSSLSDLESLLEWFEVQGIKSTIIAEPGVARWIHLAIRNPTPNDLLWMWQSSISSFSIKQILEGLGVDRVYVVCSFDLKEMEGLEIHKLREGIFRVYMVKIMEEQ